MIVEVLLISKVDSAYDADFRPGIQQVKLFVKEKSEIRVDNNRMVILAFNTLSTGAYRFLDANFFPQVLHSRFFSILSIAFSVQHMCLPNSTDDWKLVSHVRQVIHILVLQMKILLIGKGGHEMQKHALTVTCQSGKQICAPLYSLCCPLACNQH